MKQILIDKVYTKEKEAKTKSLINAKNINFAEEGLIEIV